MIHIFFVPGMFGSTIEYILKNSSIELDTNKVLSDGSMHSFRKEAHISCIAHLDNNKKLFDSNQDTISTIIYPFNNMKLNKIISSVSNLNQSKNILVYAETLHDCELNLLFQYYKISKGTKFKVGISIFHNPNQSVDVKKWNEDYNCTSDMQPWEYREWFSIFYPTWTNEWRESKNIVAEDYLKISNSDFLNNTYSVLLKIGDFCDVQINSSNLEKFLLYWQNSQKYIIKKFMILEKILQYTVNKKDYNWNQLSIIEESIVQHRLREQGFEIKCYKLNVFPTNSIELNNLLYKI
jgi:hypothetical protein